MIIFHKYDNYVYLFYLNFQTFNWYQCFKRCKNIQTCFKYIFSHFIPRFSLYFDTYFITSCFNYKWKIKPQAYHFTPVVTFHTIIFNKPFYVLPQSC